MRKTLDNFIMEGVSPEKRRVKHYWKITYFYPIYKYIDTYM
jgi:hypothetical protein